MTGEHATGEPPLFATPNIRRTVRSDASVLLTSAEQLGSYGHNIVGWVERWARADPAVSMAAERDPAGQWEHLSYGDALAAVDRIAQGLLDRGLSKDRPLVVLSENSLGHLLVTLAATSVGVPVAPVSVAYSIQSRDHERLRLIDDLVRPGAVYVEDAERYARATQTMASRPLVLSSVGGPEEHRIKALRATPPTVEVRDARAAVVGSSIAKIMFTSGSTGTPKGVITTHEMLTANQQMLVQVWPFLTRERPVLVDWLPWSHTFGGNHNLNLVLANGGTLFIDAGRPTAAEFSTTLENYRSVAPTVSFNVPAGYARLVPALEQDAELARSFFSRLQLLFSAAAGLTPALKRRMQDLSDTYAAKTVPVTASWGTTETAPAATEAHFDADDPACIGVPIPGVELKLVPVRSQEYEIRVRGALVTPGYYKRPDLTEQAFDEEGFYCPGDLVSFVDHEDPNRGLVFRGRIAEDFKLASGTFVRVGALRTALLSALPLLADVVITGENQEFVGAIAWVNSAEAVEFDMSASPVNPSAMAGDDLQQHLGDALRAFNAGRGTASQIVRLIIATDPPSLDAGEITDKGYLNQRAVLRSRAELVTDLYSVDIPNYVLDLRTGAS